MLKGVITMNYIGIDIGSTCAKLVVMNKKKEPVYKSVQPTGWSSVDTAGSYPEEIRGAGNQTYGIQVCGHGLRKSVRALCGQNRYGDHLPRQGACWLYDRKDMTVIDIGGQDTKIILLEAGRVKDFAMNDKCSAGTGRFWRSWQIPWP